MSDPAPDLETWNRLYAAAVRFQSLGGWEWMSDQDVFGVEDPASGEIGYGCVMGQLGEFFALAVYLGSEGLQVLTQMRAGPREPDPMETMMRQKCLMASFEDRTQLKPPDLQVIKQLGLKFRGRNAWPQFRSYRPGYEPWYLDAPEAAFLVVALEQATDVAARFKADPYLLDPKRNRQKRGMYLVRAPETRDGRQEWHDTWRTPEPFRPALALPAPVDEERVGQIRETAEPTDGILEMDFFHAPMRIKGSTDERPYYPYLMFSVDHGSGFVFGHDIAPKDQLASKFAESLLQTVESLQKLPGQVWVSRPEAFALLEPVTKRLGIRLKSVRRLTMLEEAREGLFGYLTGDGF